MLWSLRKKLLNNSINFTNRNILNLTSNFVVIKNLIFFIVIVLFVTALSFGQEDISYEIDADIQKTGRNLIIRQMISLKNLPPEMGDTLYFTDWSNAYSTNKSPLAQRSITMHGNVLTTKKWYTCGKFG